MKNKNLTNKIFNVLPSPEDSWTKVELWRWQYGTLPQPNDKRPLNVSNGLQKMAIAIQKNDLKNFPSPISVVVVLKYAAKIIDEKEPI